MAHSKHILITIFFSLLHQLNSQAESASDRKVLPLWSWECLTNKCVPIRRDLCTSLQSLTTCNMICTSMPLWPHPTGAANISSVYAPVRAASIYLEMKQPRSEQVSQYFTEAFNLFRHKLLIKEHTVYKYDWYRVILRVAINGSDDIRMLVGTDESYKLNLRPSANTKEIHVDIKAESFCGARHALETLSQLIWYDTYKDTLYAITNASIEDAPLFRYRGLMLDTANSYINVSDILELIDGMGSCKLNTFHWHATDSKSFPLLWNSTRRFAEAASYSTDAVYTADDVRAVVRRARLRGVRVLLEVDAPAHVGRAWSWPSDDGLDPLACCVDAEPWSSYCAEPPCGQLNPRNAHVYDLLEQIYAEIYQLTGVDDIVHLGGDDVSDFCWMKYFESADPQQIWTDYNRQVLERLQRVYQRAPSLIVMWWSKMNELHRAEVAKYGSKLVVHVRGATWTDKLSNTVTSVTSHEDVWDLNDEFGEWYDEIKVPYNAWQQVYEHRPWGPWVGAWEGGEGLVWSAGLGGGGLGARVWPRAAALAERLWSDRPGEVTETVQARLDMHRTRMLASGLKSAPMWSMWCTQNPRACL